jgi:hypothetical protein
MPLTWINEAPEPDEREPGYRDKRDLDWESELYYDLWECSRRAYEAVQQANDELYARLMEED